MKKILLVEDEELFGTLITQRYEGKATVLWAQDLKLAEELFDSHLDITVVIMDACVPGRTPNTIPLVWKIRRVFRGPIIAFSGRKDFSAMLMQAGCSHECPKESPSELFLKVDKLLDLS